MRTWLRIKPEAAGWEPWRSAWLAECALEAYSLNPAASLRLREAFQGGDIIRFDACDACQGFVAWGRDCAVLAFRGSDSLEDWKTNAAHDLVERAAYPGRVHRGFADALNLGWQAVRHLVGKIPDGVPLLATGHSLGGALAVLAAVRLRSAGLAPPPVVTFGQPKVGNKGFAQRAGLPVWHRVALGGDPVVCLPKSPSLWKRYAHGGRFFWIDDRTGRLDLSERAERLQAARARARRACHHAALEYSKALDFALELD